MSESVAAFLAGFVVIAVFVVLMCIYAANTKGWNR